MGGRDFPGAAVRNAWPIEFWHQEKGPIYRYLEEGKTDYAIPVACLQPAEIDNLLAAGRCLSATPMALASARVMGACLALGEAAGREAARLVQSGGMS